MYLYVHVCDIIKILTWYVLFLNQVVLNKGKTSEASSGFCPPQADSPRNELF